MIKKIKVKELFDCKTFYLKDFFDTFVYPWEMLPNINSLILHLIISKIDGFEEISDGVLVGRNVKIALNAVIEPPAIIGDNCEIRTGAYIRGNVITGECCVIGNSTEVKNAILLDNVQIPHYNYVGDSVLGNDSHMGAGAICSNLRSDKKTVIIHADNEYNTGIRKVGAFLGDGADVGCGCVLNPGTVIGKDSCIYPLTSIRGVVPEKCIVKSSDKVIKKV